MEPSDMSQHYNISNKDWLENIQAANFLSHCTVFIFLKNIQYLVLATLLLVHYLIFLKIFSLPLVDLLRPSTTGDTGGFVLLLASCILTSDADMEDVFGPGY